MAGTVHLAVGRASDACRPAGEAGNEIAVHVDLLEDMRWESTLGVDGEVLRRDGVFRWEDDVTQRIQEPDGRAARTRGEWPGWASSGSGE